MKLLVVEDEKRMGALLCKGLTEEGHTVTCATDGRSGLDMAANYDFDVIILDIMMPKIDGYRTGETAALGEGRHSGSDAHRQRLGARHCSWA